MLSVLEQLNFTAPAAVAPKVPPSSQIQVQQAEAKYRAALGSGGWMTAKAIAQALGYTTVSVTEVMRRKYMRDCTERRTLRHPRGIYYEWRLCTKSSED